MTPCQEFQGARTPKGYGVVRVKGTMIYVHRLAWALHNGADPAGKVILHACDNPPCVNPEHLSLGTQKENIRDAVKKGRHKTRALSADRVAEIRRQLESTSDSHTAIAKRLGVCRATVDNIAAGRHYYGRAS